ncbi:hypothetical protein [Paenibacillus methanolicus]|uniref:Streptomycin adenylyltransferase n=1 Tax=Paenibacillus methanolicus TaxID=582686 RepID=A0A5S5CJS7_9BACL|nr:hypothetical protein [Paenibacillus methanolicus]TYP78995.1 hypothetical protein BCM02_101110 [Paenibacillus methanolicus]
MQHTDKLLQRLDAIGESLSKTDGALGLLGLGSVGLETDRLDAYSDLDFFVLIRNGEKPRFLASLDWLEHVYPLAYSFANTEVGYKILFEDGIFGEFAIFEEDELADIAYAGGRMVWRSPEWKTEIAASSRLPHKEKPTSLDQPLNEALTNLYVGLGRYARGERLTALRFIQSYAIDNVISVLHLLEQEASFFPDPFGPERRLERRYPGFADKLGGMLLGCDRLPESALHVLAYIESVYPVNDRMSFEIRRLAKECGN